jgi:hypothetical protein
VLDDMERVLYTKGEVVVQTDGQKIRAYAYVWKGGKDELGSEPWSMEHYLKESGLHWQM